MNENENEKENINNNQSNKAGLYDGIGNAAIILALGISLALVILATRMNF